MTSRIRINEKRLHIYALLAEGKCMARVAQLLSIPKATVNYHASILEREGYIKRVKGTRNPILYEKGPKSSILDKAILDLKVQINATGVTSCSKFEFSVPTAKVHHGKIKLQVIKTGDIDHIKMKDGENVRTTKFLEQYFDYRNVRRWKGKIHHEGQQVTVEYEETPNRRTFYIYPPELELTEDQLPEFEKIWIKIAQEIANYLQRNAGWRFGLIELTDWQPHIGIEDPALMKGVSDRMFIQTPDKKAWTSNSEGRAEYETNDIELAQIKLTLPHQVITLKTTISEIVEDMALLVEALKKAEEALEGLTKINGILISEEAKKSLREANIGVRDDAEEEDRDQEDVYHSFMYR